MEGLPDQLVCEILSRIEKTRDRNSASLSCKRFRDLDNEQRDSLRVGLGLNPANEALSQLCLRFPNLTKVEINYHNWTSKLGSQLDDKALSILSRNCRSLSDLRLCHCVFLTDTGLNHLSSSSPSLKALWLEFAPRVTGLGILSIVSGCENLSALGLVRCVNVARAEWLEKLGGLGRVEDLSIVNCRGIREADSVKLWPGCRGLRRLRFEVVPGYKYVKAYDQSVVDMWRIQQVRCPSMRELSLTNCVISPGRGLARVLQKCEGLERIELDMCSGLRDRDIAALARSSRALRSISIRLPSDDSSSLTDECLRAVAENCPAVESVKIRFSSEFESFPSSSSFTTIGILELVFGCPVKELCLDRVCSFDDLGLRALCSAQRLEELEIVQCQEITDEGLVIVSQFSKLRALRLVKCLGVTDEGLRPFVGSCKLDRLVVEDCPLISERGLVGAAKVVSFRQDLTWMY